MGLPDGVAKRSPESIGALCLGSQAQNLPKMVRLVGGCAITWLLTYLSANGV